LAVFEQQGDSKLATGGESAKKSVDELLAPLPDAPRIQKCAISLHIDTGNVIYEEFTDAEEALDFIRDHLCNPEQILKRIAPFGNR
jgi:hypothetical protein